MQPKDQRERLTKARVDLLADQPFFGFAATKLKLVEDKACAGVWTDAQTLGYNPAYLEQLADLELRGLMADIVLRIVSGHPWRQDRREAKRWNRACAHVTNLLAMDAGFRLPKEFKPDEDFRGFPAEYVYRQLPVEPEPPSPPESAPAPKGEGEQGEEEAPQGADGPQAKDGTPDSAEGPGNAPGETPGHMFSEVRPAPEELPHLETEWKQAIESAHQLQQGDLPGDVEMLVNKTRKSRVDWQSVLHNFVEASSHMPDYSFSKPNLVFLSQGMILPGLEGGSMGTLVFARDTSGSIPREFCELINGELRDIIERLRPSTVVVLDVDTDVRKVQVLENADYEEYDENTYGGGGTFFDPVFDYVREHDIECACVVYLTDLHGRFPQQAPDYPVLWAVPEGGHGSIVPPFGELVELEMDH